MAAGVSEPLPDHPKLLPHFGFHRRPCGGVCFRDAPESARLSSLPTRNLWCWRIDPIAAGN